MSVLPNLNTQILNSHLVSKGITDALERIRQSIILNMGANNRNATKRSIKSLKILAYGGQGYTGGQLLGLRSYWVMERGRKPGKVPPAFEDIILEWLTKKHIRIKLKGKMPMPQKREKVANMIKWRIKKSGTKLHREQRTEDIFSEAINAEVNALANKLHITVGSSITYINEQYANPYKP